MRIFMPGVFVVLGLTFIGCHDGQYKCDRGESFHFTENARFEIDSSEFASQAPRLVSAQNFAFKYERWNDCKNVNDDELMEMLVFNIPNDKESFALRTLEEFQNASVHFYRTGAWFQFLVPVTEGSITGMKISKKDWELDIDITIRFDNPDQNIYREVEFKEKFIQD